VCCPVFNSIVFSFLSMLLSLLQLQCDCRSQGRFGAAAAERYVPLHVIPLCSGALAHLVNTQVSVAVQLSRPPHLLRYWLAVLVKGVAGEFSGGADVCCTTLAAFLYQNTLAALPTPLLPLLSQALHVFAHTLHHRKGDFAAEENYAALFTGWNMLRWVCYTDACVVFPGPADPESHSNMLDGDKAELLAKVREVPPVPCHRAAMRPRRGTRTDCAQCTCFTASLHSTSNWRS
jgi:hypothetical protein